MPISQAVREKFISILSDPDRGLNPTFADLCELNKVEQPLPGSGGTQSFSFDPYSPTFLNGLAPIEQLEAMTQYQYPIIMLGSRSARPADVKQRITPSIFWGPVTLELRAYFAWNTGGGAVNNDFEIVLDLFQEAMFKVLNGQNPQIWMPVVYNGDLMEVTRDDLRQTNNGQLWRRGAHYALTARAYQ